MRGAVCIIASTPRMACHGNPAPPAGWAVPSVAHYTSLSLPESSYIRFRISMLPSLRLCSAAMLRSRNSKYRSANFRTWRQHRQAKSPSAGRRSTAPPAQPQGPGADVRRRATDRRHHTDESSRSTRSTTATNVCGSSSRCSAETTIRSAVT